MAQKTTEKGATKAPVTFKALSGTDGTHYPLSNVVQTIRRQYNTIMLQKRGDDGTVKHSEILISNDKETEATWEDHFRIAACAMALALFSGKGTMKDGAVLWLKEHAPLFDFMSDFELVFDPQSRGGAKKYIGTWESFIGTVLLMSDWVAESVNQFPPEMKEMVQPTLKEGKTFVDPTKW